MQRAVRDYMEIPDEWYVAVDFFDRIGTVGCLRMPSLLSEHEYLG